MVTLLHDAQESSSTDRFLTLLRESRLLTGRQIESIPEQEISSVQGCARTLVERGMLTPYQASRLLAGQGDSFVLGQYRILEPLGSGGMGQVFRAEHQLMRRQVALKIMSSRMVCDTEARERFQQEVQLVAQLRHPNIVLAYDADEDQGLHFFVMEYVEGADLEQIVAEYGPLPIPFACECIRQTAVGLQHAHDHGLVHCDIKPSNLLLEKGMAAVYAYLGDKSKEHRDARPLIRIVDFGLARLAGMTSTVAEKETSTPTDLLAGTPDYMAPELARDTRMADIRCDLYSLGCTFSYLLTGQVPFPGGSWSEKIVRHHFDPAIPVSLVRPDVPEPVAELIARLMAKDPSNRLATPGEVAEQLEAFLASREPNPVASAPMLPRVVAAPTVVPLPGRTGVAHSRAFAWAMAVCLAVAGGLGLAWIARTPLTGRALRFAESWTDAGPTQAIFCLGNGPDQSFSRLDLAVRAAKDGDTIQIRDNGPFILETLSLRGKSLTIKAAKGFRPRLDLVSFASGAAWEALFLTDSSLTLEGLHLNVPAEKGPARAGVFKHLVYSEGAPLRLIGCQLTGTAGRELVVCRQSPRVELIDCMLDAQATGLNVEIGTELPTEIVLRGNRLQVGAPYGAVAAFWSRAQAPAALSLMLEGNELTGSRLLAFQGIDRSLEIRASKNSFQFLETLLSFQTRQAESPLADQLHWEGARNRFGTAPAWVTRNGVALPVRNLLEWRKCWNCAETGSFEESMVSLPIALPDRN